MKVFGLAVFLLFITCSVILTLNKSFTKNIQIENDQKIFQNSSKTSKNGKKLILLWQKWWGSDFWFLPPMKQDSWNYLKNIKCPETRCEFVTSSKKHLFPITKYDAIVFHGPELQPNDSLPEARLPNQIYAFANQESPRPYWDNLKNFDDFFNFTSESWIFVTEKLLNLNLQLLPGWTQTRYGITFKWLTFRQELLSHHPKKWNGRSLTKISLINIFWTLWRRNRRTWFGLSVTVFRLPIDNFWFKKFKTTWTSISMESVGIWGKKKIKTITIHHTLFF